MPATQRVSRGCSDGAKSAGRSGAKPARKRRAGDRQLLPVPSPISRMRSRDINRAAVVYREHRVQTVYLGGCARVNAGAWEERYRLLARALYVLGAWQN